MSAADAALTVTGVLILALLAVDVFATVLHHWSGSGPVARRTNRALWQLTRWLVRGMSPSRRRVVLGYVGPAQIPLALLVWGLLAIGGFALLFWARMPGEFAAGGSFPAPSSLADALYFSGVTFFTLGYGDYLPLEGLMRGLAIVEAGSGFALVTLGISYFTSVYPAYSHQQVLADSAVHQASGTADAAVLLANHLAGGAAPAILVAELAHFRDGLARVLVEYGSYPVLYHFVASAPERSLPRLIFVLHDVVLLLDTAVSPVRHPGLAGLGNRSGLGRACSQARKELVETLVGERERPPADPASCEAQFRRACATLRAAGIVVQDDLAAVRTYQQRRAEWEPDLRAAADALGEDWGEISGER